MQASTKAEAYWEHAGEVSYAEAMFADSEVECHVNGRLWQIAVDIGRRLGLDARSHVLDLGCGDGAFANTMLARHFGAVDGFDLSEAGIRRAQSLSAKPNMSFTACDITKLDFSRLPQYDGAFLYGILHHVKAATPALVRDLRNVAPRVIVLEPNGNHLVRKLLEHTAAYKAAGEDSFRTRQLEGIFKEAGYRRVVWKRLNLFPNFTPRLMFRLFKPFERLIENTPILRALCTVNMWGFVAGESRL
jgi:cyclopropane fatty-acyl-phospholipid synthase-like methyltransferase